MKLGTSTGAEDTIEMHLHSLIRRYDEVFKVIGTFIVVYCLSFSYNRVAIFQVRLTFLG
jgi:hypothetical protein